MQTVNRVPPYGINVSPSPSLRLTCSHKRITSSLCDDDAFCQDPNHHTSMEALNIRRIRRPLVSTKSSKKMAVCGFNGKICPCNDFAYRRKELL